MTFLDEVHATRFQLRFLVLMQREGESREIFSLLVTAEAQHIYNFRNKSNDNRPDKQPMRVREVNQIKSTCCPAQHLNPVIIHLLVAKEKDKM